mmetsp:Transcript_21141/g.45216  ORF Transcript_21141/g.45216 Transcript_21141/m.45216 type:complete len:125 (+) Transcript_21141:10-384(+)
MLQQNNAGDLCGDGIDITTTSTDNPSKYATLSPITPTESSIFANIPSQTSGPSASPTLTKSVTQTNEPTVSRTQPSSISIQTTSPSTETIENVIMPSSGAHFVQKFFRANYYLLALCIFTNRLI